MQKNTGFMKKDFRLFGITKSIATPPKVTKPKKTKREERKKYKK